MADLSPAYLDAFIQRLERHDWFYEMADDSRTFKAGQAEHQKLEAEARADPLLLVLFNARAGAAARARDGRPEDSLYAISFGEFCDVVRRRHRAATTAPDREQRLARAVRQLAALLTAARPDSKAPEYAINMLQQMGLLEIALAPTPNQHKNAPNGVRNDAD